MTIKTTNWYCDTCRTVISRAKDGMVEWCWDGTYGMRLVHHDATVGQHYPTCQRKDTSSLYDHHLPKFLGPAGLLKLTTEADQCPDRASWLRMVQRLHVPGYELARHLALKVNACTDFHTCADIRYMIKALGHLK